MSELANSDIGIGHFRMSELANSGIRIGQLRAPNTLAALPGSRAGCPAASLPPPIPASCRRPAGARLPAPNPFRTVPNPFLLRSQPILPPPHCPGREAPPTHRPRGTHWQTLTSEFAIFGCQNRPIPVSESANCGPQIHSQPCRAGGLPVARNRQVLRP